MIVASMGVSMTDEQVAKICSAIRWAGVYVWSGVITAGISIALQIGSLRR